MVRSGTSHINEINIRIEDAKNVIVDEIKSDLKNELKEIIDNMNRVSNDVDLLKVRIGKIESLNAENFQLKGTISDLNSRLLQQENLVVANDIRLSGIPEYNDEY